MGFFRVAYIGLLGAVAAAAAPRCIGSITGRGAVGFLRSSIHEVGGVVAGCRVGCVLALG